MKKFILGLILLAAVAGSAFWYFKLRPRVARGYQAVFLSNGQVYFGKLTGAGPNYMKLDDVYYLLRHQVGRQATESAKPQFLLRKLGAELHGPKYMLINRRHVLFTENLKDEGRVVKAIREHKAQTGQ